ncbi:non-ribosomal peptide synthetase [Corallococcus sp. Z5C101001]|uniref:non-ribosomal peptide synthetase n=1 Tax=Corallococcus sp. Z5C101001 TaxID=2596829 RepID=UPI00163D6C5D|nr:non-ribosomal peptide synthetase [Corallococcus sp. Z5C101001]
MSPPAATLVELLRGRAEHQPDALAYAFWDEDGTESRLTYAQLDRRARAIAARLLASTPQGERALLLYPAGLDYVAAFFGCLYAKVVAVPAYPPNPARLQRTLPRLQAIVRDARSAVALTLDAILPLASAMAAEAPDLGGMDWIATDVLPEDSSETWRPPGIRPGDVAFLQYTSGSTSHPKGVVLSHQNLLANSECIRLAFEQSPGTRGVFWLPPFHDMGLIGGILQPLYSGYPSLLMAPETFLRRPLLWLQAISRFRGTTSGGPNFAFDLCVRKSTEEQRAALDLSSWRVAFNGAEPIRPETLARFAEAFAVSGFRPEAFMACYGLAEASLIVSSGAVSDAPPVRRLDDAALGQHVARAAEGTGPSRALVSCGRVVRGHEVLIVDPVHHTPLPGGHVGELWVRGPSIARGYWENPAGTEAAFHARLADGQGPFLRTGDLGFLEGAELFVTGRAKDLLIIRGRNHSPQDLERTAEAASAALRPGSAAAFSVEQAGEERAVLAIEAEPATEAEAGAIARAIRQAVADSHGIDLHAVCLLRRGALPKTSSGKVQRQACRRAFLEGTLEQVGEVLLREEPAAPGLVPPTALASAGREERPALLQAYLLGLLGQRSSASAGLSPQDDLLAFGLDSLATVQLAQQLEGDLGVRVPTSRLLDGASIESLALTLSSLMEDARRAPRQASPGTPAEPGGAFAPAGALLFPGAPAEPGGAFPLSAGQRALWLLQALDPTSTAYHLSLAVDLRGPLEPPRLTAALQTLVDRHEALRLRFGEHEGEPFQEVLPREALVLGTSDLSGLDEARRRERLADVAHQPFDLKEGPVFRAHLASRGRDHHVLLLSVHHLVADYGSLSLLLDELRQLLARAEHPAALPAPASGLARYVAWQQALIAGPEGARQLEYYRERLGGAPPLLALPTDRPWPPVQTFAGARHPVRLEPAVLSALAALARAEKTTLFVVLLAGFQALLHRHTGQDDLTVGAPFHGRTRAEHTHPVGYLVNVLPLRSRAGGPTRFRELVQHARREVLGALDHQELPFPVIVERLRLQRDPSRPPGFQVLFALDRAPTAPGDVALMQPEDVAAPWRLGALEARSLALPHRGAAFELSLLLESAGGAVAGWLEYNTDLFDASTVERMAGHLNRLLASAAAGPDLRLAELELLSSQERQKLLEGWNPARVPLPEVRNPLLHHGVFEQARRTPEAIAVSAADGPLTYSRLASRASQLAHHLAALGIGPDVPVGVCLRRDSHLPVALLGVLAAGGAYVPMDPDHPAERMAFVLADARIPVLITEAALLPRLPAHGARVVLVDGDAATLGAWPEHPPQDTARPGNLAYVIYTSGSTGRPKGVMIEHHSATSFIAWAHGAYSEADLAWVLAGTSITFDLSVFELFAPLSRGGRVELVENVLALADGPGREHITLLNTVPSAMSELVSLKAIPRSVRVVNLAGEPLSGHLVRAVHALLPECRVYNLYGPTEDTTYSTFEHVPRGEDRPAIGRPLAHRRAYVLDARMEPVPPGVTGELYLGGEGVARGYLARPELTAAAFVADPFSPRGGRLYRTGDLARWRPDGRLDYLGRNDHQLKLRGHRLDLGEITAVLAELPGVVEALVSAIKSAAGEPALCAYVVLSGTAELAAVRDALQGRLPRYMVPAAWVRLEALPRLPNGKVDREALPLPARGAAHAPGTPPRDATEARLAGVWSELLGVSGVSVDDDFFALGGHSLMVARLAARIRGVFGTDVPLARLFQAPTLEGQARALTESSASHLAPLAPDGPREAHAPLSFAQERLWFLEQFEPGSPAYNIPTALRLRGELDVPALRGALDAILERHEALRTGYVLDGGRPFQQVRPFAPLELPVHDCSHLPGPEAVSEALQRASELAARPFDLREGRMLRARLMRVSARDHVLALVTHHIAFDGSHEPFAQELGALYSALQEGRRPALPAPPAQYPDFAVWQRSWLRGEVLEAHLAYWKRQLAGPLPTLQLPTDRPRPAIRGSRGGRLAFRLPAPLVERIDATSRAAGTTLFQTLLAAFWAFLGRLSEQEDILVAAPMMDRPHPEVAASIGNFVNTVVHRGDLRGDPSLRALLGRARAVSVEAQVHAGLPFNLLVEALQPERSTARTPIAQVMLSVLPSMPPVHLTGLSSEWIGLDNPSARFDLLLAFSRDDGELSGLLEYSSDLFDAETAVRLRTGFETFLSGAVAALDLPVSRLPMLTPAERTGILDGWNATRAPYSSELCLHQLFEARADARPEAVALVLGERSVTYGELEARANRLAHHLRGLGVGPGVPVALLLERGLELVPAMLAVLKAGGCYVPLPASTPPARVRRILEDHGIATVLSDDVTHPTLDTLRGSLPGLKNVLCLDGEGLPERLPHTRPSRLATADDLAYIIFTSGSTGTPKGVAVRHRPVINLVEWVNRTYRVGPDDRVLFVTSIGFDLSVYDVFGLLAAGGSIRVATQDELRDPSALARVLETEPITLWDSAPATLVQCVPYFKGGSGGRLRRAFLSGDWIPVTLPEQLRSAFPAAEVVSLGGATEAVIWSNHYPIGRVDPSWASIPYGKPIQNARYHVLDRHLEPCPVGVPGDLFIAGDVLAEGYVGDAALTASRFIADPWRGEPGARMYRTGDRARYRPDGNLEFLGRLDQQVKIRGFRIELGELETVLSQHAGVRAAVVLAHGEHFARALCAYVVPASGHAPIAAELRAYLREHVPDYMVPAAFVLLASIPLTPSGKVDRKALPAPSAQAAPEAFVAPGNELEALVSEEWRQALGVDRVGVHDNFFDLGGNSLLVVQLHHRLEQRLGRPLPLVELLQFTTVHTLAAHLRQSQPEPKGVEVSAARSDAVAEGKNRLRAQLERKRRG